MSKQVTLMTDAIPYQEFAKLIGKSTGAVRRMIDKGKLPVIDMTDPQSASGRAGEYWVYLPAWNNGLKLAYESRPKEIRDGWLMWLGSVNHVKENRMNEPRCIAQLLRNESPRAIDFTITHGKGRKGIIIRTKKQSPLKKALTFLKSRRVWK